jgi:hypothetical protein
MILRQVEWSSSGPNIEVTKAMMKAPPSPLAQQQQRAPNSTMNQSDDDGMNPFLEGSGIHIIDGGWSATAITDEDTDDYHGSDVSLLELGACAFV